MTTLTQFPIGYHALHGDVSLNFQMNRFYNWVGDPRMLDEMRAVAPRIDLRIHVARRRHIILVERGLHGDSFLRMEIIGELSAESNTVCGWHPLAIHQPQVLTPSDALSAAASVLAARAK